MKKKFLYSAVVMALTLNLVACGDGSDNGSVPEQGQIVESVVEEPETNETVETETVDETDSERLQTIAINLEEAEKAVQEQADLMLQNLELAEYLGESVNLICTKEWLDAMIPGLQEGYQNYFLQKDGRTKLFIQAGYGKTGTPVAKVWYFGEQVRVLRREGSRVQLLETGMVENQYRGSFTSWTLDGSCGDIYQETGTFGDGVLTGDYTIAIHKGTGSSDIFSLWNNKESMKYTTYNGHFNEQGISTLEQPTEKKVASLVSGTEYPSCIVYAIDVNDCLFQGLAEGEEAATYVFEIEKMGWENCPSFTDYELVEEGGLGYQRMGGTLPKDKTVTRPAAQTPAPQPEPAPQPQQPSQPEPVPQPQQPSQPQQPTPQPSTPPADDGNSGNETDIEWTPDFE